VRDSIFLKGTNQDWDLVDYLKLLPAIIIAILIFYLSSLSNPLPTVPLDPPSFIDINIMLHMCEFAGFSYFVAYGYFSKFNVKYAITLTIIYAILDEVHQYFVPYRYFDGFDILIDIIGIVIGFLAFILIKNLIERLHDKRQDDY